MDDAMELLQESVKTIVNTTKRINAFESVTKEVVTAMNNITNKISSLEAKLEGLGDKSKESGCTIKLSLLAKVKSIAKHMRMTFFIIISFMHAKYVYYMNRVCATYMYTH